MVKVRKMFEVMNIYNNLKNHLSNNEKKLLETAKALRDFYDYDFPFEKNTKSNLQYYFEDISISEVVSICTHSESCYYDCDDYFVLHGDYITSHTEEEVMDYLIDDLDAIIEYMLEEFEAIKYDLDEILRKELEYLLNALEE